MARTAICVLWLVSALPAFAQQPPVVVATPPAPLSPPSSPPPLPEGGLTVRDASVGYIDSAALADQLRLRADFGFDFLAPNRAEFFYSRGKPLGPGVPFPERAIDFQDYTLYLEKTLLPAWSVFAEGGLRALNPDINANVTGFGDMNIGFKYAFVSDESSIWTFQFRTYAPTGAASRGLGNRHVTLEPAVLGFVRLSDTLGLASEVRYWQPVGGSDFAAGVLRYGLGVRYDLVEGEGWRLAPTAEAIGWTVMGGKESRMLPDGSAATFDSAETTVVNLKLGARLDFSDRAGLYAGYGRAITGEKWYRDVFRVEFRWLY